MLTPPTCCLSCRIAECSKVLGSKYGHALAHFGLVPHGSILDQANAAYGAWSTTIHCTSRKRCRRAGLHTGLAVLRAPHCQRILC